MSPGIAQDLVGEFYPALGEVEELHHPPRLAQCSGNAANKSNSTETLCKLLQDGLEMGAGNVKPGVNHMKQAKGRDIHKAAVLRKPY